MTDTRPVITFAKHEGGMPMPHLLDIQTRAFESLLVPDDVGGARQDVSLERVFRDLFPISDVNGKYTLDFVRYALGEASIRLAFVPQINLYNGQKNIQLKLRDIKCN